MEQVKSINMPLSKRIFDLIFAILILIIFFPVWGLFLFLIFLEHTLRGYPFDPFFYSEYRISMGRRFRLYKFNIFDQRKINLFRSKGEFIHTKDFERRGDLILMGKFLKQIYMDEIPQLWNVIKGDMSIVGPRPLNEEVYNKLFKLVVPAIAIIKAGLTGPFQSYKGVEGRSDVNLNAEYINECKTRSGPSLVIYDILVILRTIKVVLLAKGI